MLAFAAVLILSAMGPLAGWSEAGSEETISRTREEVAGALAEWSSRPLDLIHSAFIVDDDPAQLNQLWQNSMNLLVDEKFAAA